MPCLPPHPDLDQLRRQAKDLLRAAQHGDTDAVARVHAVSDRLILDSAQLAVAREYGFASWARLKTEVTRREIFDARDVARLNALLAEHPELAVEPMLSWCDHPQGASPLGYVAMLRYDTCRGIWRKELPGVQARRWRHQPGSPPGAQDPLGPTRHPTHVGRPTPARNRSGRIGQLPPRRRLTKELRLRDRAADRAARGHRGP